MNNYFFTELGHRQDLIQLIPEIKDLYLMINCSGPDFLTSIEYRTYDTGFVIFNLSCIPEQRYPRIHQFYETELGSYMSRSAFFTETDTRNSETKHQIEIHNHIKPTVINFPLINCNKDSQVHFYNRSSLKNIQVSSTGIEYPDLSYDYVPEISHSSSDGIPILLNAKEFHSVSNNGIAKRITFGWHLNLEVDYTMAVALTSKEARRS